MKLKRITPTDGLKQITFGELKDDWSGREILTPSGWAPILRFEKIKTGPTVIVKHRGGELRCDPKHRLRTPYRGWVYAGDLPADGAGTAAYLELASAPGLFPRFTNDYTVRIGPTEDLYDVEIPTPHAYNTSGLVSHNSIMLCNNAIQQSRRGQDVLLVTFELDMIKTALRCLGALTGIGLRDFQEHRQKTIEIARRIHAGGVGSLYIVDMPPDECSVDHVYQEIYNLERTKRWRPKVVCLDYLELMVGRRPADNKDDYVRQKQVANQVRGLARKEKVVVYTATQGNRSSNDTTGGPIDLKQVAESYGKTMSLDYVISLNQTEAQYNDGIIMAWIAKNRNGQKRVSVNLRVNYNSMGLEEAPF